jgi:hypothetical protein
MQVRVRMLIRISTYINNMKMAAHKQLAYLRDPVDTPTVYVLPFFNILAC